MCNYCEKLKDNDYIMHTADEKIRKKNLYSLFDIYIDENNMLTLGQKEYNGISYKNKVQINYCPMCARQLK